ncbi:MAG: nucleotide disphospho-sugar-binding domain-containing protein [Synechococcaceae cyanobacterium]|nr:nucleotide disphospho-sugar-binding domain-containing protein [Synechococcaceae cyanobacterium]
MVPPAIGHLNPMVALALELRRRGHRCVLFCVADGLERLAGLPLELVSLGVTAFPAGSVRAIQAELGRRSGLGGLRWTVAYLRRELAMLLAELPEAVRAAGCDALVVDQVCPAGGTVAERLGLPFISVANALPINREAAVPPYPTGWQPGPSLWRRWRNQAGNALLDRLTGPLWHDLQRQRQQWGLPRLARRDQADSPLLQLAQLPRALDFERERLPPHWHDVGPLLDPDRGEPLQGETPPFPWQRLDGRPLIYAALGTLQIGRPELFAQIAAACAPLDAQLVLSLGNPAAALPQELPGQPLVVPFAPQRELIGRAAVVITHAGLNTTLTALSCGVPLVAIPITNEQPGIAARLQRSGAGLVLPLRRLNETRLRLAVHEALEDPGPRRQAERLQQTISAAGGVRRAAALIERSLAAVAQPT